MKVKKFSANNNQEVLSKVKNELGPEAIILYQRKVKPKGIFGIFKKPIIEVVAAKEETSRYASDKANDFVEVAKSLDKKPQENKYQGEITKSISKEMEEMKEMLQTVVSKMNQQDLPILLKNVEDQETSKVFHTLKDQGLDAFLLEEIIHHYVSIQDQKDKNKQSREFVEDQIKEVLKKYIMSQQGHHNAKTMFFVGPTGVGKTTTIAKLAAHYALNEGKTVGLISADTYRIAAVEQLKVYSDILNIPLKVIYHSTEIHKAIEELRDKDIIMVDTAGRSHKNIKQVLELKSLLNEVQEKETYLVISCTSREKDIKEIINTYDFIENYNIIFTKVDEATAFGTIINTAKETQKPIAYMTTGQSVPDDIEEVDIKKIVSLLTKEATE
ncbi:flagellar biosynthesis protein FlhF [Clostridium formicaceticum]|uniref:Flagellar biosynthesis protein FlhF n=1 Tax=Clostridium formicaceticum TaxID=1497 RepID=A0AAC9RM45_9CLOT|nr:flagellar biosynthesis protein FlhF [Clostridium formicaceticum]AOY77300.1 flagellar biosynthesis protein FlhF [Clostridium formicaceticum]ARE87843.1 Flagellar biosynthesis protein FlhF [Clostridium formicaceticum]